MQAANIVEDYSIRSPLTGDLVLSRLVLTGWGAVAAAVPSLELWTDRGRLWVRFTQSDALLEFFRRPTLSASDLVCSGTVSNGVVTLAQANSSGISGSAEATNGTLGSDPTQDSTTQVIVSYAHENDLIDSYAGVAGYLNASSKWYDQNTRFEAILRKAKRELDELIAGQLGPRLRYDSAGRRQLADISDPRQIAPIHALYTCALIEFHRSPLAGERAGAGQGFMQRALELLRGTLVALDYESDANADVEANMASGFLVRA